jgi:hypothetical protein
MLDKLGFHSFNDRVAPFDETKGYRIHILTGDNSARKFNEAAGVYGRDWRGRFELRDNDLRDRQILRAHGVDEIIELVTTREKDRIVNARVVFNGHAICWENFFLHLKKPDRYAAVVERLQTEAFYGRAPEQVVLMEFTVDKIPRSRYFSSRFSFNAKPIDILRKDWEERNEYVVPGLTVEHSSDEGMKDLFREKGRYFVLGLARLNTWPLDHAVYHYFNIKVTDTRQVYSGNILDIWEAAKTNAASRAEGQAAVPPAP